MMPDDDRAARRASGADRPGVLSRVGRGVGEMTEAFGRKLAGKRAVPTQHVDLIGFFEQAPNPDSRIVLGDARDALGQRKVCIDWRLTSLDRFTYRKAAALFCAELARVSGGHCKIEPWLQEEGAPALSGAAHHIGTTRMSEDPRYGVVEPRCRVHGVDNLYVAGSSVFPTGGWAFPTFTIVAMSLRLADHLKARAASRSSVGRLEAARPSSSSFAVA
jgi:choline dehydrogenase-like flavoprotein